MLRHRMAAMAGAAGDMLVLGHRVRVVNLRHVLLVNGVGHRNHGARDGLVVLSVGRKIELVGLRIHRVAEIAFHSKGARKTTHNFDQVLTRDILRQHLQVYWFWQWASRMSPGVALRRGCAGAVRRRTLLAEEGLCANGKNEDGGREKLAVHFLASWELGIDCAEFLLVIDATQARSSLPQTDRWDYEEFIVRRTGCLQS